MADNVVHDVILRIRWKYQAIRQTFVHIPIFLSFYLIGRCTAGDGYLLVDEAVQSNLLWMKHSDWPMVTPCTTMIALATCVCSYISAFSPPPCSREPTLAKNISALNEAFWLANGHEPMTPFLSYLWENWAVTDTCVALSPLGLEKGGRKGTQMTLLGKHPATDKTDRALTSARDCVMWGISRLMQDVGAELNSWIHTLWR